jgi:tripartite-type tricarboxylate transporter receptor subunit TctC
MFMARIHPLLTIGVLLGVIASVVPAYSQEPFYKGKTIRMIVGLAAGGGYDTYSRLIARHMNRYIPGNPTFVVENMDGAGSVIAANHIYKVAKPDGLTIGHILGGLFLQQLRIPTQIGTHSAGKSTLVPIEIGTCSGANRHPCLG